jgi:hypothetical protein
MALHKERPKRRRTSNAEQKPSRKTMTVSV